MPFRIAVCDDNAYDIEITMSLLSQLKDDGINYNVTSFNNGDDIISEFANGKRFDMLVLDMVMQPINGIETAREIRKYDISIPILIVTSTTEYALDGYQVGAWGYLTKPLKQERFIEEIKKIYELKLKNEKYFVIDTDDGTVKVKIEDIMYFDSDIHTITVHTIDNKYSYRGTIGAAEQEYAEFGFFRVHKSFLVNMKYITHLNKLSLTLVNGETISVSKNRVSALRTALLEFVSRMKKY